MTPKKCRSIAKSLTNTQHMELEPLCIGISVSESLRLFLHRHSDIIICRPLFAQWHPLRMITFANLERCIFSL